VHKNHDNFNNLLIGPLSRYLTDTHTNECGNTIDNSCLTVQSGLSAVIYIVIMTPMTDQLLETKACKWFYYASELIKHYELTCKEVKLEKFGCLWKCVKLACEQDIANIAEELNNAYFMLIDGSLTDIGFYDAYTNSLYYNFSIKDKKPPITIISLEKTSKDQEYLNINQLSK